MRELVPGKDRWEGKGAGDEVGTLYVEEEVEEEVVFC